MNYYGHAPLASVTPGLRPRQFSENTEPTYKEGLSQDLSERPSRIRFKLLLPTLAVFFLTSGLGLAVLVWLFVKLRVPIATAFQSGYLLVDEGVKYGEGSSESATLRALTATSFISTLISLTSPVLMALIAYRIAYLWVAEERRSALSHGMATGPTPLQ
ncbi:hypothetical protein FRC07_006063 [Ceratobasidium sp. 392]|nr:hypothetical protein FRC07_006063 [Ceratobasidium sp. 392]